MSGTLPPELGDMEGLEWLYLTNNHFSGTLPSSISNLKRLKILAMPNNTFSSFPEELGNIESLEELNASNAFTGGGALPESIGNLRNLTAFVVGE